MIDTPHAVITGSHGSQLGAISRALEGASFDLCSGTDFFTTNYHQGLSWYLDRIREARSDSTSRVVDVSGSYFVSACADEPVAPRAAGILGRVPMVIVLRDPVDGFLLAWKHAVVAGRVAPTTTLDDILRTGPDRDRLRLTVGATRRHHALAAFSKWFGDQLLCVALEDLVIAGSDAQRRLMSTLRIDRPLTIELEEVPDASDGRAPVDQQTRDQIREMVEADAARVREEFGIEHGAPASLG